MKYQYASNDARSSQSYLAGSVTCRCEMASWMRVVAGLLVVGQLSGCASGGGLSEGGKTAVMGVAAVALVAGLVLLSKDRDDDDDKAYRECRKHHSRASRSYCDDYYYRDYDRHRNSRDDRW
ncbi:hypothetical protein NK553_12285 [Pseudomonas sp. ZM23]|uniref:Lipoprotein n=1 Tax=Pseudomonas triclosanedens TaxID=2961893 RepID=A0ABY7A2I1_9PSED|nr:hypothetical protein [Pseudomonas triclosanedens]MCP8464727.1 hypothetical protein [Pseudomonas triclosanedens]MCP8470560.1 hypothetical protein [Pseudomonas triclosanedens]MCP8476366.1 hypothetical protein [Pseudomonas triclosanedens]WAI51407.1 hypothetical protein OU419_09205 [Pseudomonas triclosanedens]